MSRKIASPYVSDYVDLGETKQPTKALTRARTTRPRRRITPVMPPRGARRPNGWRDVTAGQAVDYGYKAYQMAKGLVRLINVEEKIFDVDGTASGTVVTSTPTVVNLSNVAQGTDYFNRVGNSIRPQSYRFAFSTSGNANTVGNMLRVLVVQDKENQGVDPTMGEVLAGASQPILAPSNPETGRRFRVLVDESIALNVVGAGLATAGTSAAYIIERKPPRIFEMKLGGHIFYDDTAGADASNLEGAIFLMMASTDASDGPAVRYHSRLTFTDN